MLPVMTSSASPANAPSADLPTAKPRQDRVTGWAREAFLVSRVSGLTFRCQHA